MPQIKKINIKDAKRHKTFDAEFLVKKEKIISQYENFFRGQSKKGFLDVVSIKRPKNIKEGDLVFHNKGIKFKLEIATENRLNKARHIIFDIKDKNYSKEFVIWFFNQKEIQEYLSIHQKGNIIVFLPQSAFKSLDIIYPTKIGQKLKAVNITTRSDFKDIVRRYLDEYQKNIVQGNYFSASFLVGAICEAIIYQFLVDNKVKEKFLDSRTFGGLLEVVGIMNLDMMNIQEFKKIQKFRNLIHPKNAVKNIDKVNQLEKEIEKTFNEIIKNFGI